MPLHVQTVALNTIKQLAGPITRIAKSDRDLARQIRRSASSVALNIAEGAGNRKGTKRARYSDALGSCRETRAALQVALAWNYVDEQTVAPIDAELDRVCRMLYPLALR